MSFIDLSYEQGDDGIYDLAIEDGDFVTTQGLEAAIFVSLFSDRRAYVDEVADARKRRGWDYDTIADIPGDKHGSGIWLYEQHRLTEIVANGVRLEAEQALQWMIDDRYVDNVEASVARRPVERNLVIRCNLTVRNGSDIRTSYVLADATRTGSLVNI
jgi:phage gp46-like protein